MRYYAGARAAAGTAQEQFDAADVSTLRAQLVAEHGPRMGSIFDASSLLVDGIAISDRSAPLSDGVTIEILPPFAGG